MNPNVMNWRNQKGMPEIEKIIADSYGERKKDAQVYNNGIHSIDGASGFTKTRAEDMEVIILLNVQNVVNL